MNIKILMGVALLSASVSTAQADGGLYGVVMGSLVDRDASLLADTGYGAQLVIGGPINRVLNWEANAYGSVNGANEGSGNYKSWGIGADLAWSFIKDNPLRIFMLGGLGAERDSFAAACCGIQNSPFVDVGLGAVALIGRGMHLRTELRSHMVHYKAFPGSNNAFDYRINVGVGFGGATSGW